MLMNLEVLRKVGLSAGEVTVYQALLALGSSSMNAIQEKTGISRRNIYDILAKLIEKGLATYTLEKGKKTFQLTHPNKITSYVEEKKQALTKIEEEMAPKLPILIKRFQASKSDIRAEVFRGNESIKALLEEALEYKKNYWLGGNCGLDQFFPYWWKHYDEKRIKKKVFWYDLADYGLFLSDYEKKKLFAEKYYELRFLPKDISSPMVIFMFGNKVAQILWSKQSFAFVLESKEVSSSFMNYFKHFWNKAN